MASQRGSRRRAACGRSSWTRSRTTQPRDRRRAARPDELGSNHATTSEREVTRMSVELAGTTVRAAVEVMAPIEQAFHVFTDDIGSWWNPEHHILQTELAAMVF